jgi:hypothetical protein
MSCCKQATPRVSSNPQDGAADGGAVDRYTTFVGIDCEGNTRRVIDAIRRLTLPEGDEAAADPFWAYFHKRRHATTGVRCDDLLLLASFVNQVRELFETHDDQEGLRLLDKLEDECF